MSATRISRPLAGRMLVVSLALLCCLAAPRVEAATVLLAQTSFVTGTESTVDSFTVPSAGTVTVQLSNLPWPQTLSSLSFMANSASAVLSSWSGANPGLLSFQVGPGTYFAHVTGTAAGSLDLGLYSLKLTFQPQAGPVPLPASGWLLVVGVLMFLGMTWARRERGSKGASPMVDPAPLGAR